MKKVVIAGAARTAVGKFGGALKDVPAVELGALVIREALKKAGVTPSAVEEVIMGNTVQAGLGQNPARQAALKAGLSEEVPAHTVNKVCGSGLKAVALAAQAIRAGDADCVVAGGMESMSGAPYLMKGGRWGLRLGHGELADSLLSDGLTCAMSNFIHMGETAENIAERYKISREEQDAFAATSQQRAEKAVKEGRFREEIVPCPVVEKKGTIHVDTDEFPRFGTTREVLRTLKPAFKENGTVTAGNASGINDGAAAMVVLSNTMATTLGITPLATIVASASCGVDPLYMGLGPVGAVRALLKKTGLSLSDMEIVELNEAFAAQALGVLRELPIPGETLNVNGGAIALGHPIGASGARILTTLLYEMKRRGFHRGLATLCIGGGQGMAMIVERE